MSNFWGMFVQAQGLKNKQRLFDYHARVKPPFTLVMEGDSLALELRGISPTTNVISRHYFADGTWYKAAPADFLNYLDRLKVSPALWFFVENESGVNPDWNIELIKLNAARTLPYKLVILNLAVGTPDPLEWTSPKVVELLRLCDQYREWVIVGIHEYYNAVVTSGFIGGYPDNAGVDPRNIVVKPGENLIPKMNWPPKERHLTHWHMGRFAFMVNACKANGFKPPRIVLTEAGADDVSDIKQWTETLTKTPPYTSIRGWRSLVNQWAKWYPLISADQIYADMLTYAANTIYADSIVEGGCIYCYATPNTEWTQFDVEGYEDFLKALERIAQPAPVIIPIAPVKPVEPPKTIDLPIAPKVPQTDPVNIIDLPPTVQSHKYEVTITGNSPTGDLMARFLEKMFAYSKIMFAEFVNDGLVKSSIQFEYKEVK